MHFLYDGGFLRGISGLGQAFCAQQPVLLMMSRKEDLAWGSLSPSWQLHWGVFGSSCTAAGTLPWFLCCVEL